MDENTEASQRGMRLEIALRWLIALLSDALLRERDNMHVSCLTAWMRPSHKGCESQTTASTVLTSTLWGVANWICRTVANRVLLLVDAFVLLASVVHAVLVSQIHVLLDFKRQGTVHHYVL